MKLALISDTHNRQNELVIPECDVLIHSGDFTMNGTEQETQQFVTWLGKQQPNHIVLIAGNHDKFCEQQAPRFREMIAKTKIIYLNQESTYIDGLHIYGVPLQYDLPSWAFYGLGYASAEKTWAKIPDDTDILITHPPPYRIGDQVNTLFRYETEYNVGDKELRKRVEAVAPQMHIFGHIHEGRGSYTYDNKITQAINASSLDHKYRQLFQPIEWEL